MALCEKRVDGQLMSYPCQLPAGHEQSGPPEDPEPCATPEVPASMRRHAHWQAREEARATLPPETAEQIAEEIERSAAEAEVVEPEHNLRDRNCAMRPVDSLSIDGEICPTCSAGKRPQVLVDNDEAIRAGHIHNPFAEGCNKRVGGEISLAGERCYICNPSGETFRQPVDYDNGLPVDDEPEPGPLNSFVPAADIQQALDEDGAPIPLPEQLVPTKQRPGDQVLPKKGDRPVQDFIIARERQKQEVAQSEFERANTAFVIGAMEESKRVGTERYGQPLHTFDGRLNIRDLADELRDGFVYVSKMQMVAEADRGTLVRMVQQALDEAAGPMDEFNAGMLAEVAVDKILDWVLIQRMGPEQVMPIRPVDEDKEWMGT